MTSVAIKAVPPQNINPEANIVADRSSLRLYGPGQATLEKNSDMGALCGFDHQRALSSIR
jgi:hypothetical protein